ncbi:hypothetical protein SAY86_012099 [Trapa natans]|uniref:Uncharacterized protein n=1 Tax=Trapa natans TaxID=22666 RepID=A0AAN7RAB9_TRANT|nr:hypothetical protein SAY86_012099 [Trapa natans]
MELGETELSQTKRQPSLEGGQHRVRAVSGIMGDPYACLVSFFFIMALLVIVVWQVFLVLFFLAVDMQSSRCRRRSYDVCGIRFSAVIRLVVSYSLVLHSKDLIDGLAGTAILAHAHGLFLMCLADLEFDYINPYDSSSRINGVVLPEFIVQGVLCLFYLGTGHWVMCLLSVPYLYYNVNLYLQKQHLVDVTEIYNMLKWEKKQRLFKLGYLIILLLLSIFWMIMAALDEHDYE